MKNNEMPLLPYPSAFVSHLLPVLYGKKIGKEMDIAASIVTMVVCLVFLLMSESKIEPPAANNLAVLNVIISLVFRHGAPYVFALLVPVDII